MPTQNKYLNQFDLQNDKASYEMCHCNITLIVRNNMWSTDRLHIFKREMNMHQNINPTYKTIVIDEFTKSHFTSLQHLSLLI